MFKFIIQVQETLNIIKEAHIKGKKGGRKKKMKKGNNFTVGDQTVQHTTYNM
jgi:hypothetical protein